MITIQLQSGKAGNAWAYLGIAGAAAPFEIEGPRVVELRMPKVGIHLKLRILKRGLIMGNIDLCNLVDGDKTVIRVFAPGRKYKSLLGTVAGPRAVVASLAASSAAYAFLKCGNRITGELALDVLYIALGTILVILFFALARYLASE